MKKHLKILKTSCGNLSSKFHKIAFVYLSVMSWIVSSTYSSSFKFYLCSLLSSSVFDNVNAFRSSRSCCSFDFVFSVFRVILEKFIAYVWNTVKEGNCFYGFELFKVLEKPFAIDPPVSLSISNIMDVSNKSTCSL